MEIGILSMQRVINYGSFLQAFALKETLKELGHDCYFIDIKPGRKIIEDEKINRDVSRINFFLKRIDKHFLKRIKHNFFKKNKYSRFNNEFFPILGIGREPFYYSKYDAVVIGSDEVFNCIQKSNWGLAKTLFGEGLDSNMIITYAASCGYTTLEKISQYGIREEIKGAMRNLNAISVRDKNTKRFVEELTGKKVNEHIDPTLIYDFKDLVPKSIPERDYILIYAYDGRINDNDVIKEIRLLAKKEKKQVISVGVYQSWCDKQILCTPFELLSYFKNADYIVTDTFHGTVFSIKYNKQFVTIVRESNKQKLTDLLEKFNLENRLVSSSAEIPTKLINNISYDIANKEINKYKNSAIEYLSSNLVLDK